MVTPRVLLWHAESCSYIEATGEEAINHWWEHDDGLLSDVTDIPEHEAAFLAERAEEARP